MKQASITITGHNKKKSAQILLEGSLGLGNLHAIHKDLMAALNRYTAIHILAKNITAIDLTGIQLLFAIKKSSETLHKKISFDIELPNELNAIISQAGFQNLSAMLSSVESELVEK